jgi:hypothetical protein
LTWRILFYIFSLENFSQRDYVWNENVISQIPRFYPYSVAWFIFFFALYPMFNVVCRELFPKFYAKVAVEKRAELMSYCVCVVHHAVVVPFGMYKVYKDMMRNENELRETNYADEVAVIIPFIIGYFLADTLAYAVPKAMEGNLEFLYHHTLGLGLTFTVIYIENALVIKMCPHMLMCEVSSLFFTFAYFLRLNGYRGTSIVTALELLFALSFFLTRNVNLSMLTFALKDELSVKYPVAMFFLVMIVLLQFYWLYKIVKSQLKSKNVAKIEKNKKSK